MDTQVAVDDEMFALLESYAGKETSDERVVQLAGESLDCYGFTGLYFVDVPPLDETVLADWDSADAWLDELGGLNSEEILPNKLPDGFDICAENAPPPSEIFASIESFKRAAIKKLGEGEQVGVAFVEVTNSGKMLNLVYDNLDHWAFDFSDRIKVLRDADFTEENGYYEM